MINEPTRRYLKALPVDLHNLYQKIDEPLPHSAKRWWWCWGGVVGMFFGIQVVTGLLLAFYYRAEPQTAYDSVLLIQEKVRYGGFLRSVHNWGATFMILALFLHMTRVFVTGAFREYRWGAWMAGVALLGVTFGLAFTGYSLLSSQLSYWGVTVTSNILGSVPIVGDALKRLFLAGDDINEATLSRMYALHVQILPVTLVGLVVAHLFFVRLFGMHRPGTARDREDESARTKREGPYHFYPDHLLSETAVFLYVLLLLFLLALAWPAALGPRADPAVTPEHIKPEWYFYPFFHGLKLVPGSLGVILMMLLGAGVFFWPILDHYIFQKLDRLWGGKIESGLVVGVALLGLYLVWAVVEAV